MCSAQYAGERERMATADQSPESRTRAARREMREGEREKEIVLIREIFSSSAHRHTWCTSNAGDGVDAVAVV